MNLKKYKRIAIMGGTFDPIHYGHLVSAEAVREAFGIDLVLFMPTGSPPHKEQSSVTPAELRYSMTELATVDNPYFCVSRIEIDRPGKTYTIDTVRELLSQCGAGSRLYFITGADAVHEILTWKDAGELLRICTFIAVTRPGYKKESLLSQIELLTNRYEGRLIFFEVPSLAISSTEIRARVKEHRTVKYLMPSVVEEFIYKNKLYRDDDFITGAEHVRIYVKSSMSAIRYAHTLGTAEESVRLARHHGANPKKAYLAALFHDCAKEIPDKKKLCDKYGLRLDAELRNKPELLHGYLAAAIAEREFGVRGRNLLNAMRYHTTGRPDMSLLEKILFVADMIEINRSRYHGLNKIRALAYENLDMAVCEGLRSKIIHTNRKKACLHPLSLEAFDYYERITVK